MGKPGAPTLAQSRRNKVRNRRWVELYKVGLTAQQIADQYGMQEPVVSAVIREAGVSRGKGRRKGMRKVHRLTVTTSQCVETYKVLRAMLVELDMDKVGRELSSNGVVNCAKLRLR